LPDQRNDVELITPPRSEEALVDRIIEAMRGLRFGSLEIVVHEGRVVQIERREKLRFDR
jgi:hypothetical protein